MLSWISLKVDRTSSLCTAVMDNLDIYYLLE